VTIMRWYIRHTCAGFEEQKVFFSAGLFKRELGARICKQISEIRGPRWI
jgi:hypothetical protein